MGLIAPNSRVGGLRGFVAAACLPVLLMLAVPASAADIYVNAGTGNDSTGDGSSGDPYRTIKKGLASSASGDTIHVAAGTYDQSIGEGFPLIMRPGVAVISDDGAASTIIQAPATSFSVIRFPGNVIIPDTTRLEGFTLLGGQRGIDIQTQAPFTSEPVITRNTITGQFVGVQMISANNGGLGPWLDYNYIYGMVLNGGWGGYGVYIKGSSSAPPVISRNAIYGNAHEAVHIRANGGPLAPRIVSNDVAYNEQYGIWAFAYGTGELSAVIAGNYVRYSTQAGVSVRADESGTNDTSLLGNAIFGNGAYGVVGLARQGNPPGATSRPVLTSNAIFSNASGGFLARIADTDVGVEAELSNNILAANTFNGIVSQPAPGASGTVTVVSRNDTIVSNQEGGLYDLAVATSITVQNAIVWDNVNGAFSGPVTFSYSDVQGAAPPGPGNISADPLFVDLAGGNLRLTPASPCIDAGDSTDAPVRDFEGEWRSDDPDVANTGTGAKPYFDMGADEYVHPNADTDGDTVLDVDDNCPQDVNPLQENHDTDALGDACDPDDDNDGILDANDNCPIDYNPNQNDNEGDGIGDVCDPDDDDDGILDDGDASGVIGDNPCRGGATAGCDDNCPILDNPLQEDEDADGIGTACDDCTDTDGDGWGDPGFPGNTCFDDNCPAISNPQQTDSDTDGIGDECDPCTDSDGDGFGNPGFPASTCPLDNCPLTPNVNAAPVDCNADTDVTDPGEGAGEQCDSDGDGIGDVCDNCPTSLDTDGDNVCDDADPVGTYNPCPPGQQVGCDDNCPLVPNPAQLDLDLDGLGDACDPDDDGDGVDDTIDNCPRDPNPGQENADGDALGDACDPDADGDGIPNGSDNCPLVPNPGQANADGDADGDACDTCTDTDGDGFGNPGYPANTCPEDNCPNLSNPAQIDSDSDGRGNACDPCPNDPWNDMDSDGVCGDVDNCPNDANSNQANLDGDPFGDACDPCTDTDGDGFGNPGYPNTGCGPDNCPAVSNPSQADLDGDTLGDACDPNADGDAYDAAAGDCNDLDPDAWLAPGEVGELRVAWTGTQVALSWIGQEATSGPAVRYDILSNTLGSWNPADPFGIPACDGDNVPFPPPPFPATGSRWYLVRADLPSCGAATWGPPSLDTASPCP